MTLSDHIDWDAFADHLRAHRTTTQDEIDARTAQLDLEHLLPEERATFELELS